MRPVRCTAASGTAGRTGCATPDDVNALVPPLWPRTVDAGRATARYASAGVDVRELAAEFGTPAYVLDEDDFRARCRDFRAAFAGADVFYAGKAFLLPRRCCGWSPRRGCASTSAPAASWRSALRAGMPPERIGLHGNNKSVAELSRARARPGSAGSSSTRSTRSTG